MMIFLHFIYIPISPALNHTKIPKSTPISTSIYSSNQIQLDREMIYILAKAEKMLRMCNSKFKYDDDPYYKVYIVCMHFCAKFNADDGVGVGGKQA